jgi:putative ABC transport system permease protein
MVVSRMLGTQREQIATLKAFGYTRAEVTRHYLGMVIVIALAGAAVGIGAGAWLGMEMTRMYAGFFRFPEFDFRLAPWIGATGVLVALGTAGAATLGAIGRAVSVPPAEAMRPEAPAVYRRSVLEVLGVMRYVSSGMRMAVRNLERRPVRSLMTCVGTAAAVGVLVVGSFIGDTIDYLMEFEFSRANRQTLTVTFVDATGARAESGLRSIPGVMRVETFRAVAARIEAGHVSRRVGVMGMGGDLQLFPLIDRDGRQVDLPAEGVLISLELAKVLGVDVGDTVRLEVLEGRRPSVGVAVGAVIDDLSGLNVYMRKEAVWRLMREGPTVSGAYVLTDPAAEGSVYRELKETPRVAGVSIKSAMRRAFEETVAATLMESRAINLVFAVLIAVGVVYNSGRIALAERARDLATLRVLGLTRREVGAILLGEQGVLTLVALAPGLAMGWGMAWLSTLLIDSENHRFPLVISARTYALAVLVVLGAAGATAWLVSRRVAALSLVEVLKSTE